VSRAVIFINGSYADLDGIRARLRQDDYLVCADGALRVLDRLGLQPQVLLGDFDSVEPALLQSAEAAGVELIRFPQEKDYTDGELALRHVAAAGYRQILLLGAWGGRIDHSLGNLLMLPPYVEQGIGIALSDGRTDAWLVNRELTLSGCRGKLVSLLPLSPEVTGIALQGFYYSLDEPPVLRWGASRGLSNVPLVDAPRISVEQGMLLVIVTPDDEGTAS
jgi:thiamine pyrophosphokinase